VHEDTKRLGRLYLGSLNWKFGDVGNDVGVPSYLMNCKIVESGKREEPPRCSVLLSFAETIGNWNGTQIRKWTDRE